MTDIAEKIAGCSGGQKCYWDAVRAINGGDSRAKAVAVQKFLDSDGNVCSTPAENADAAAKHFTRVYNGTRERPPGAAEAVDSVKQRPTRIDLDAPISESELDEVLRKAKPGKATSNMRWSSSSPAARAPRRSGCSTGWCRTSSRTSER